MPPGGIDLFPQTDILSYEEITRIASAAAALGISKVRLTGGEPLVRDGLPRLVKMLSAIAGIDDISLTTNGVLLDRLAGPLRDSGLRRVNVSLDSLDAPRFRRLTRGGDLALVLGGIEAAARAGLAPVKINVVVMGGVNDDEVERFARLTISDCWHVRFIELMPFVNGESVRGSFVPVSEIRERLGRLGRLEPSAAITGNGPARYYRLDGASGTIGFISPVSEHFCFSCNRLRLTADGKLRACLLNDSEIDLRLVLRNGGDGGSLQEVLRKAILSKPRRHNLDGEPVLQRPMTRLGG
jgi:cyclic pyranopterin phosphate synthase